jgi:hypothetical protein
MGKFPDTLTLKIADPTNCVVGIELPIVYIGLRFAIQSATQHEDYIQTVLSLFVLY